MNKVLIISDMQNDFVTGSLGTKEAKKLVEKIVSLQGKYDITIFTQDTHNRRYDKTPEHDFISTKHCIKGSNGWKIVPALDVKGHEIIRKSEFGSKELINHLKTIKDIDSITLSGLYTDLSIIENAKLIKEAFGDIEINVLSDYCLGTTSEKHVQAIKEMDKIGINILGGKVVGKNIAIVTGASSGMGKQFVLQLGFEGLDEIWAIGLGQKELIDLTKETKTKVVPFNLDLTEEESYVAIRQMLAEEKPNVQWLCVCAGFGKFGRWDEICINQTVKMIDLNCKAYVLTTEYILPFMRRGSRIVMIASVAGFQPIPYINVYAATKAFTISYARALNMELKPSGISVTCVCPYWTKTNFFDAALKTNAKKEVVTKYEVMYNPYKVIDKAINDAKKRKELSIYGSRARFNCRMVKLLPHKTVMKIWMRQQKLKKKYW